MSTANPTPLQVGMSGTLGGKRYTIAGRVVLSVEIDGETYEWNEFNLVNDAGEPATLVYEEGERGPEWRLFTIFDPPRPMSAAEAATKRVGDTVNLTGYPARVTLVDQSLVLHIEGRAPEGVEVGDVADYFNLEAGNQMWVVSWTGEEVECFRGMNLPAAQVAKAFGLAQTGLGEERFSMRASGSAGGSALSGGGWGVRLAGAVIAVILGVWGYSYLKTRSVTGVPVKTATPAPALAIGATGKFDGQSFRVAGVATLEVRRFNAVHDWHEFHLKADDGARAVLVQRYDAKTGEWRLLRPVQPAQPLTPHQAAALRVGDLLTTGETQARVREMFQARVQAAQGDCASDLWFQAVLFGVRATAGDEALLARWTDRGIEFLRGRLISERDARAAFTAAGGR